MQRSGSGWHGLRVIVSAMWMFIAVQAQAEFYVYEAPDGTRWITDHRPTDDNYTLLRRFGFQQTAKVCAGMSKQTLAKKIADYEWWIAANARAHKLDKALILAVIHVESCFNEQAVSRAGASGLMQLMPATARRYGVTDIFEPRQNIRGGVTYLRDLVEMFDHDKRLVLAAYNAGENAVKKYNGIPPYKETQQYVKRVLHYYEQYKYPATDKGMRVVKDLIAGDPERRLR